jgi:predicted MFS family arabinose efflux permease
MASAMSLDAGSSNAARMAGPAIGGVVLATWGIGGCFAIGAMLFLVGFAMASGVRYRNHERTHAGGMFLDNITAAIKLSIRERPLAGFFVITLIFNLFALPILSLVPVIGQDHLGLGAGGIGLLASMDGVGALAGALACFFFARTEHYVRIYTYSTIGYLIALMAMAVLPHAALAGLALIVAGFGNAGFGIMQSTLIFHGVRPEMRALLLGLLTVAIGTGPLGFLQIGLLAESFGAQLAVLISGVEGLVALVLTRPLWRTIRATSA